jgi:DNA modification methylase
VTSDAPSRHVVLIADSFDPEAVRAFDTFQSAANLILCDAPYGITKESWDVAQYNKWMTLCASCAAPDATICMWGGTGKPKSRPFLVFEATVEENFPEWEILNFITWGKKRAYGVPRNYLYTREELLIMTRGKPTFNIPLLEQERGYEGYNKKYPAKSKFLRRTNVWTDINELFKGKTHPNEKPQKLYEVLINTHTNPGDVVFDPCAGSGVTQRAARALGRHSVIIERERKYLEASGILQVDPFEL